MDKWLINNQNKKTGWNIYFLPVPLGTSVMKRYLGSSAWDTGVVTSEKN